MKIIEFFGLPFSGKTYYCEYLKKKISKNHEIFNVKNLIIFYLRENNKENLYSLCLYMKYRFFKDTDKSRSDEQKISLKKENKSIFFTFTKKFLFKSFLEFHRKKNILFKESKKKYQTFFNLTSKIIEKEKNRERKKILKRWFKDELISVYIANFKKKEGILLMSEGFIQRFHSYYLYEDELDLDLLKNYLNLRPKSDFIFFVDTSKDVIKDRLENFIKFEKNKFYFNNLNKLDIKFSKITNLIKHTNDFYVVKNEKNLSQVFRILDK